MVTIKELRKACKKPYWGRVHRCYHEIGFYFTKPFVRTNITPSQVTVMWIILQTVGAFLLATGTYKGMLLGIIVYHLGFFVDCVDGNLARLKNLSSWKGVYLEQIAHHITITFLLIGLTIGTYRILGNIPLLIVGIVGTLSFLFDKLFAVNLFHFKSHAKQSKKDYEKDLAKILGNSSLKNKHWVITNIFAFLRVEHPFNFLFFLLLFGIPHIALVFYSTLFLFEMLRKLRSTLKRLGELG